jgi:tRNA(adenine34) deaminase
VTRFDANDEKYMRLALCQALTALDEGEIAVGCALVSKTGEAICTSRNRCEQSGDLSAHAEMLAIRQTPRHALDGCTLYVTLEPCPMCAGAIALSGIERVVFGAKDVKYGCCGSVYRLTEDPAFGRFCRADGGLLREECEAALRQSFEKLRKGGS